MKKIKCGLCTGAWIVEDKDLDRQKICPYCGKSICGEIEFSEYDSLDKAIYGAVSQMGKDILQNPKQLVGFLMDMAPNLKNEIHIFSKTVNEDYAADISYAFEQEPDAAGVTINNKLRHFFVEKEGLSDNWADTICEGLYGAVLFSKGIGTSRLINVGIVDFEENNQSEMVNQIDSQKKIIDIYFSDIKNKLEENRFKNIQNGKIQNCFEIFLNSYHLLENGVRHIDFAHKSGFYGCNFICQFFYKLELVTKEKNSLEGVEADVFKISDLGTAFYKAFTRERM